MSDLYDNQGNHLGALGADFLPSYDIGGAFWEMTHPGQVQQEYSAVGKEPPPMSEIITGAASQVVEQTGQKVASIVTDATKYIVIAGVAYLAWQLFKGK